MIAAGVDLIDVPEIAVYLPAPVVVGTVGLVVAQAGIERETLREIARDTCTCTVATDLAYVPIVVVALTIEAY